MNLIFHLYIVGQTVHNQLAVANLHKLNKLYCNNQAEIKIIDLSEAPEDAISERVIATPTLVKVTPPPKRQIIGDLSDLERAVVSLGLGNRLDQ